MKTFSALFLFFSGITLLNASEVVRFVHSDLLEDVFEKEAIEKPFGSDAFTIEAQGSYFTMQGLEKGEVDVAVVAHSLSDSPLAAKLGESYHVVPLGYRTFFLTVNRANPLSEISVQQARNIFVQDSDTKYQNWESLGLAGQDYVGRGIQLFSLDQKSIVFDMFEAQVMDRRPVRTTLSYQPDFLSLTQRVATDDAVVALFERKPEDPRVKILAISSPKSEFAFLPTSENLFYGDYPFGFGFYLVFKKEASPAVQSFARSVVIDDIMTKLAKSGLVMLDEKLQQQVRRPAGL